MAMVRTRIEHSSTRFNLPEKDIALHQQPEEGGGTGFRIRLVFLFCYGS